MMTSCPCASGGKNGIGGATITLAMVESSSGAASASATNEATTSGVAGRILMQTILEPGNHSEVPSAAPDRPEKIRMRLCIHAQEFPVSHHDLGSQQVVDRKAVLANEVAHATT